MKNLYPILVSICCMLTGFSSYAQVPAYNSYPSATATVFLDFDGHHVTGTSWNGMGPFTCQPATLNATRITEIFNRVAEDYRPFNINITTDSTKYWAAPANRRIRLIITATSDWYGSAGGVAYVGSFLWPDQTPAFVFSTLLGNSAKNVAEAASHEIGHTLGLRHQSSWNTSCIKTAEYNAGTGTGEISWAPIMGNGYYKNQTLWHYGANPYGCTNFQDDLSIITSASNGFGFRTDDHSDSVSSCTQANFSNNQFDISGIIERATDVDVVKFTVPSTGTFSLDAIPYNIGTGNSGSNLDMQVELMNSSNTVLGVYNPENILNLSIDTMLTPDTYYLRIQGAGNVYAPEYASLGSYSLNASFVPSVTLPLHKLELAGIKVSGHHQFSWIIEADETIVEQVLQVSINGTDFTDAASPSPSERNAVVAPKNSGTLFYRLFVSFDDGKQYYSNIVTLKSDVITSRPRLNGNSVQHSLSITSQDSYQYAIYDYSGRMVAKGLLIPGINSIETNLFTNGLYLIQFFNGQEMYTEKFMKR